MLISETQIQIKFNIRPSGILKPHLNWHLFVCRTFAFWKVKTLDSRFKSYFPEKLSICTLISLFCILVILNVWIAQSYLSKDLKGNKISQRKSVCVQGRCKDDHYVRNHVLIRVSASPLSRRCYIYMLVRVRVLIINRPK